MSFEEWKAYLTKLAEGTIYDKPVRITFYPNRESEEQWRLRLYAAGIFQRLDGDRTTTRNGNDIIEGQTILIRRGLLPDEHDKTVRWVSRCQEVLDAGYHAHELGLNISN